MPLVAALFAHQPAVAWLCVACLLLTAECAGGGGRFAWPAVAALGPALLAACHVPLAFVGQALVFAALTTAAAIAFEREQKALRCAAPRPPPPHGLPTPTAGLERPSRIERLARPRRTAPKPPPTARRPRPAVTPQGDPTRAPTLIGRTGRTLGEFSNGLGRIWLDGREWGAELAAGDALPPDRDVQVLGVTGGVRLRVAAI